MQATAGDGCAGPYRPPRTDPAATVVGRPRAPGGVAYVSLVPKSTPLRLGRTGVRRYGFPTE